MRTFTDALNRSWSLEITVATLKRIRAVAGVDLIEAAGGTLLDRLVADPVLLGDVLYACVKPQADERKITDEDFGRSLAGDTIDTATTALLEEFVAFFPSPRRRVLTQALAKLAGWRAAALTAAEAHLNDPALDQAVLAALRQLPEPRGASSGSAPASAGSTPPG
ncbi:MAG: hypothetical protein L6R48_09220 [Planctomycetes bacterium]|nr:hypothetical protein [Planctomycetota bacterium]